MLTVHTAVEVQLAACTCSININKENPLGLVVAEQWNISLLKNIVVTEQQRGGCFVVSKEQNFSLGRNISLLQNISPV